MIRHLGRLSVAVAVVLPISACTILEWGEETGGKAAANQAVMAAITSTGPSQQVAEARRSASSPIEGTNSEADQGRETPEIHLGTGVFIKSPPLPVLFVEVTPVGDITRQHSQQCGPVAQSRGPEHLVQELTQSGRGH